VRLEPLLETVLHGRADDFPREHLALLYLAGVAGHEDLNNSDLLGYAVNEVSVFVV